MSVAAYDQCTLQNFESSPEWIEGFLKKTYKKPAVFNYYNRYAELRKVLTATNRLIKCNEEALKKPELYFDYIQKVQSISSELKNAIYKVKVRTKKIPENYRIRYTLLKSTNILSRQTDLLIGIDLKAIERKGESIVTTPQETKNKMIIFFSTILFYVFILTGIAVLVLSGLMPIISGIISCALGLVFMGATLNDYNPWGNSHC